jgi:hypothetical protein
MESLTGEIQSKGAPRDCYRRRGTEAHPVGSGVSCGRLSCEELVTPLTELPHFGETHSAKLADHP